MLAEYLSSVETPWVSKIVISVRCEAVMNIQMIERCKLYAKFTYRHCWLDTPGSNRACRLHTECGHRACRLNAQGGDRRRRLNTYCSDCASLLNAKGRDRAGWLYAGVCDATSWWCD